MNQPSQQPIGQPSQQPIGQPSEQPIGQPSEQGTSQPSEQPVLIFGEPGGLGDALARKLAERRIATRRADPRTDAEARDLLLAGPLGALAVVSHDDVLALRLTLLCEHVLPGLPLWTTLFDRTMIRQLCATVPEVNVVRSAELVAEQLAEECSALAGPPRPRWRAGVRVVDDALRLMLFASAGLLAVLAAQTAISMAQLREGLIDAIFFSTRMLATVADAPGAGSAPAWFKICSTIASALAVVLISVFTAAVVRRLSRRRLTTLVGPRCAPAAGHALLVGLGQVGFRLAQSLRARGHPVIAIERSADSPCVRLAPGAGIPVAIGRGDDREVLERAGVRRCAVVAAVTSDDLMNVAVGLAVRELAPDAPLVLRLGDGEVARETDSLLHLGRVVDVHELASARLADEIARVAGASAQRAAAGDRAARAGAPGRRAADAR
ncbi:MAG TPA: NAD-binding protein [Solirubrobacteraceae bacterium]|nr:NAD-binding protein [Solirubrobacteraceae bacterium]